MLTVYDNIEPSKETIPDKSKHFMKNGSPFVNHIGINILHRME